ncbi:hypothetical protein J2W96_002747 [Variovorax guangxiensis]|nr:hypothetical protein [Variovorax guangxiensis]
MNDDTRFTVIEMARAKHPNKDVEAAVQYAEDNKWIVKAGGHWGFLYCPYNDIECRCGTRCKAGIWGTPKNPGNHAKQLKAVVDGCTARKLAQQGATARTGDEYGPAGTESK